MTRDSSGPASRVPLWDLAAIRQDFPLLRRRVHGKPLVYLDNAATTQKPRTVIDRVTRFYAEENANVHRGVHWLSERATDVFEEARATIGRFVNARRAEEIVFVRGTTEAINLVAGTYGRSHVGRGDEVEDVAVEDELAGRAGSEDLAHLVGPGGELDRDFRHQDLPA